MTYLNKLKFIVSLLIVALAISSCEDLSLADLDVENQNDPDRERALAEDADVQNLLAGSTADVFFEITNVYGVHMNGLSDQMTSTNAFFSFWDFAEEPRLRLNNRTTYADADVFYAPWSTFNSGVSTANTIIQQIEIDGQTLVVDGVDVSQKMLASAYFLRGISRGYLGAVYDQGYIVNPDTDLTQLETVSYTELINAGLADIEQAMTLADGVSDFTWDYLPTGDSWNIQQFKVIANSMAARIAASEARTASEAASMDWNRVLTYANAGLGGPNAADGGAMLDFTASGVGPFVFYNNLADWSGFLIAGGIDTGAGYLPTDLKVIKLLDNSYPANYPAAPDVLAPAESEDPRIGYYVYTTNFGFLNPTRNRSIFTNYWSIRMFGGNNWGQTGQPVVYMTSSEIEYLRAEANLMSGNAAEAATILNNSPFGTGTTTFSIDLPAVQNGYILAEEQSMSGGNTIAPDASVAEFQTALLTEYSVELYMIAGIGTEWFFMRRHDMLQAGTALHYPIPGQELEITGASYYTFGGAENTSEEGTADGANSWKQLLSSPAKTAGFSNMTQADSEMYGPKIFRKGEGGEINPTNVGPKPKRNF
ncbi:RagB/SusD family nutrient uptake outer membrane protein [Rhodohalobacter sulfatireducens]|uniref:RagB/SusD family nutrient uptake outer membrane protein n=1 Tax=Rhodohalobacter sulfatireducens TaxID=2911366 RepID=A0ABS9KGX9_9BACT|nr:RagB/SusD family nutrient uptake outer membrane protein [Rhodohalobacter sulfatireducens]MCG2590104.1 RagB/SusD family nutrient uptake outer membrane protein [Rhodohalobacter sulfatireducens]MDR9367341.1 RagB/SusD family nutrient uptake outer membrane protein [Balneolaceae bacterium]MDR9410561.1 RagB/SusD family nutrient uptake outer membrane protein [Balneolaceae bacterium]